MLSPEEFKDLDDLLMEAEDNEELTVWEQDFVSGMIEDLELYGTNLTVTPKQQEILDRIEEALW